ncbi:MAG: hypothetical protein IKK75_02020 [Clostridia bacterium]|nr:hypothetical protein [Clostridia bacterium]
MECQRELTADEIGLHKKMIHRGATEFMCITCLAAFYHCDESLLRQKIEQFREQGCLLFTRKTE